VQDVALTLAVSIYVLDTATVGQKKVDDLLMAALGGNEKWSAAITAVSSKQ
jgi:hypothetical protein